jgi:hypothetical protein
MTTRSAKKDLESTSRVALVVKRVGSFAATNGKQTFPDDQANQSHEHGARARRPDLRVSTAFSLAS